MSTTKNKYSPSVNIVRDSDKDLDYIVTENAESIAGGLFNDYQAGLHSFNLIGSFGTGKSSFLWALEKTLINKKKYFRLPLSKNIKKVEFLKLVGSYNSLQDVLNELFSIKKDYANCQKLFDAIFQKYRKLGKGGLLVITIDEFGKFLEYAAKNDPEKEIYFIQQFAEFINDSERNIILLTVLHQGVDSYSQNLDQSQRDSWRKVNGRFKELVFNEPVEQLLNLASVHFQSFLGKFKETNFSKSYVQLQSKNKVLLGDDKYYSNLKNSLYPLDIYSAHVLARSLQKYGQGERSLFSYLNNPENREALKEIPKNQFYTISMVHDYLNRNFYSYLNSKYNPDYSHWHAIKKSLQRSEFIDGVDWSAAQEIIKTIGILEMFSSSAAKVDLNFIVTYCAARFKGTLIKKTIRLLEKWKVIRYSKFNFSYKLFAGSDLDIERELLKAEGQVPILTDLLPKLKAHFDFPVVTAKAHSYVTGTPRLFEYELTENPISTVEGVVADGIINLIFSTKLKSKDIVSVSKKSEVAILHCLFTNTDKAEMALFEIEKTKSVLKNIEGEGDRVAIQELQSILRSNKVLLNHYVLDMMYSKDVKWFFAGKSVKINNRKELNKFLSKICDIVYSKTPIIRNELINRNSTSGAISSARKKYFSALCKGYEQAELGFDADKFPPEKTIYYTLLENTGIHKKNIQSYQLNKPSKKSALHEIWQVCEKFLKSTSKERRKLVDLIEILKSAPYGMKQGVIDFWIPTFLFVKRGDYALYSEDVFKPYINEQELYLIVRNPHLYEIKSFELSNLRLSFFNRYRELLRLDSSDSLAIESFIESIRPILLLYKGLTPYAKETKKISKEARSLREAIVKTKELDSAFFESFPRALGFDAESLLKAENNFDDYILKFHYCLEELKDAYSSLLNRIEEFIQEEIFDEKLNFADYKPMLAARFKNIKGHQLHSKQRTFLQRLSSPLDDRDSWIASIGQVLIGKALSSSNDEDELLLKENFINLIEELDNINELHELQYDAKKEDIFKLELTSNSKGKQAHIVRISKSKLKKASKSIANIEKELGNEKQLRIAILAQLLNKELRDE